jgi:hypothetical protein
LLENPKELRENAATNQFADLIRDQATLRPADFADGDRFQQASESVRASPAPRDRKISHRFNGYDKSVRQPALRRSLAKRPPGRDAAAALRPLREFLERRYTGVQQSKARTCQEKNQLDKKKERKKKDRERRVAQKKHAEAQKRTQDEKTAQETSKTGRKSGLFTIPVTAPKPTQIAASVPKPFNHRRGGGG